MHIPFTTGDMPLEATKVTMKIGSWAIVISLLFLLGGTLWWAYQVWNAAAGVEMSRHGYIAMTMGIIFSIVIGCGLMVLMFYSSGFGYDNLPSAKKTQSDPED